jgi:hypothetical protein
VAKNPFDENRLPELRALVSKCLPGVKPGHASEALAAGWGERTHAALLNALRTGTFRNDQCTFNETAFTRRLIELGHSEPPWLTQFVAEAIKIRTAPPPSSEKPTDVADHLRLARSAATINLIDEAAELLGYALTHGTPTHASEAVELLRTMAHRSKIARCNLAIAFCGGHGNETERATGQQMLVELTADPPFAAAAHAALAQVASIVPQGVV